MSPHRLSRLTRRTLAAGGLAATALLATGCGQHAVSSGPRSAGPSAGASAGPSRTDEGDRALVRTAMSAERRLLDRIEATADRHRQLRGALATAAAVHRAHVQLLSSALADDAAVPPARPTVPANVEQAMRHVRAGEQALVARHTRTAMAARSGTFARLLAVMAAAAAQQEHVLGQVAVRRRGRPRERR